MLNLTLSTASAALVIIVLAVLPQLQLWRRRARAIKENGCKPANKYPHVDPLLGLDYFAATLKAVKESRLLEKNEQDFSRYGSTFQFKSLGSTVLMTRDWAIVRAIMTTDFDAWGVEQARYTAMKTLLGRSFFIIDGSEWKHKRALSRPALAKAEYGDLPRLERHVKRMIPLIPRDGSAIDMDGPIVRLMQTSATEHFLGEEVDMLSNELTPEHQNMIDSLETATEGLLTRLMIGPLLKYVPTEKRFAKACYQLKAFAEKNISKAISRAQHEPKPAGDVKAHRIFLDDMVTETTDRSEIRDAALTMYMGGVDTTAGTLVSVVWVLSRHPEVVKELRKEIAEVCGGEAPDYKTLQKLTYLKATIYEVMRLYGVTKTFNYRSATRDTILPRGGGKDGMSPLFVKKGTTVQMDYSALHRDPATWGEDFDEFKPERFLGNKKRDLYSFQPFGGGARQCPGQNLAFTNTLYVTTRLLQEFKSIESRDDRPWTEQLKIATKNKHGAIVAFVPAG